MAGKKSDAWIAAKIEKLRKEGRPEDQSVVIAYSMGGRSKKSKKTKKGKSK